MTIRSIGMGPSVLSCPCLQIWNEYLNLNISYSIRRKRQFWFWSTGSISKSDRAHLSTFKLGAMQNRWISNRYAKNTTIYLPKSYTVIAIVLVIMVLGNFKEEKSTIELFLLKDLLFIHKRFLAVFFWLSHALVTSLSMAFLQEWFQSWSSRSHLPLHTDRIFREDPFDISTTFVFVTAE